MKKNEFLNNYNANAVQFTSSTSSSNFTFFFISVQQYLHTVKMIDVLLVGCTVPNDMEIILIIEMQVKGLDAPTIP